MSLAQRLQSVQVTPGNKGCQTCPYVDGLSRADREAFDRWLEDGHNVTQLWEICVSEGLQISYSGFLNHRRHHKSLHERG